MSIIKVLILFLSLVAFLTFNKDSFASDLIENFNSEISISQSSQADVTETIEYNFGTEQRHGIYRDIPFVYRNKDNIPYQTEVDIKSVTDEIGTPYNYSVQKSGENVQIKIGDPNSTISGIHKYVINYSILGAVTYFSDHDEFYWDITGEWPGPINNVQAKITLDVPNVIINNQACYTGSYGSASINCQTATKDNITLIQSTTPLNPGEQISAVVSFPKGFVSEYILPEYKESNQIWGILTKIYFVFINLIIPLGILIYWLLRGRDAKDDRLTVRMYDPPKLDNGQTLSPIEVGAVTDEVINPRDISAEIINLAIKKYLKIVEKKEKSFIFTDRNIYFVRGEAYSKDLSLENLNEYQRTVYTALELDTNEETSLDNIKDTFSLDMSNFKNDVYEDVTKMGLFKQNPETVRKTFYILGVISIFFFAWVPAIMMMIFARYMPSKTSKGVQAKKQALGLKEYLVSQDDQLKYQEKNFYFFEKLLPYAIVFGVAKEWASKFSDLTNYNPDWYTSSDLSNLTTLAMIDRLQDNMNTIQSGYVATSTTSSGGFSSGFGGGGGFSGGGFGGGGGGSW